MSSFLTSKFFEFNFISSNMNIYVLYYCINILCIVGRKGLFPLCTFLSRLKGEFSSAFAMEFFLPLITSFSPPFSSILTMWQSKINLNRSCLIPTDFSCEAFHSFQTTLATLVLKHVILYCKYSFDSITLHFIHLLNESSCYVPRHLKTVIKTMGARDLVLALVKPESTRNPELQDVSHYGSPRV